MRIVPKEDYSCWMNDKREYRYSQCPWCGVRTSVGAETKCQATQGYDGEYDCPVNESNISLTGRVCTQTDRDIKREDDLRR